MAEYDSGSQKGTVPALMPCVIKTHNDSELVRVKMPAAVADLFTTEVPDE
jgi:hypothetical protein